jgi:cysteine synthase A
MSPASPRIYDNLTELIGNTPLLRLHRFAARQGLGAEIIGKLEYFNPAGSVKDRTALAMLDEAEKTGRLKPGAVIIEPTSGNTGIGLASVAAAKGYKVILTMPETMSLERRGLLKAYGAELVLTEGGRGMKGAIDRAEELARETPGAFVPGQFVNPANPAAHKAATGPEIWRDPGGRLDIFVAGIGTGGTISGTGEYLKEKKRDLVIVGVEPADSRVLNGEAAGPHQLQGIGAGFIPDNLNTGIYDEVLAIGREEAFAAARLAVAEEGLLVGISSGAALAAAVKLARRPENAGRVIVVILPDNGERYLSPGLFAT